MVWSITDLRRFLLGARALDLARDFERWERWLRPLGDADFEAVPPEELERIALAGQLLGQQLARVLAIVERQKERHHGRAIGASGPRAALRG